MLLTSISFALSLILKFFSIYIAIVALFTFKKFKKYPKAAPKYKFAIIIAARNEAPVIGETIDALYAQDYPKDLFDVFVFPNNCTDNTSEVAAAHNANIIECDFPVKNKGDVMHFAINTLMSHPNNYDLFLVLDADTYVDNRYLSAMNDAFCSGINVAMGRIEGRNPYDSWVAGCYANYFSLSNIFYSRSRSNLGVSAKLIGTGFVVRREIFEKLDGWNTTSISEDAEFAVQCALLEERISYVPGAIAYAENPNSFLVSLHQRKRWISGIMHTAAMYVSKVISHFFKKPKLLFFDYIIFLLLPFSLALSYLPVILTVISYMANGGASFTDYLLVLLITSAVSYIGTCIGIFLVSFASGRRDIRMLKGVLTFPIFSFSWKPIQFYSLFVHTKKWKEIRHGEAKLNIEQDDTKVLFK